MPWQPDTCRERRPAPPGSSEQERGLRGTCGRAARLRVCGLGARRGRREAERKPVTETSASCFLSAWLSAPGARRARTPGGAAWPLGSAGQPGTLVRDARARFRSASAVCAPDPSRRRLCPEGLTVAPALPGVGGGCGAGEAPGGPGPQVGIPGSAPPSFRGPAQDARPASLRRGNSRITNLLNPASYPL